MAGDTSVKRLSPEAPFIERNPAFSPNGKWVAYSSTETGSDQIYVRPFPGPGPRYPVTVNGGSSPVWSLDGSKLYYRSGVNGARMEEATLVMSPQFTATRRMLFERPYNDEFWHRNYDLSRDGKHFLVVRNVGAAEQAPTFIVHNWGAEVRARSRRSRD
jgi:serine/threonine-protein kinase